MWDGLYPQETEQALTFRANNPQPTPPKKPSVWAQAGEIAAAPFKGVAQAGMQTARNINTVAPMQAGNPLAMTATEQEDVLADGNVTRQGQDTALRKGVDAFKPDPVTATTASMILQDGARLLTKVGMYSMAGGFPAAVAGTGVDEGVTGYKELRDQGVDSSTAAKVGVVRGVSTAVGVALPAVGKTALQTAGLVVAGGPASFMTEQAITRSILEQANYPELAREHDPTDPVGLGVSLLVPGVVGTALHRAKIKAEKKPVAFVDTAQDAINNVANDAAVLAADPDVRDAAHVAFSREVDNAHILGDRTSPEARAAHSEAVQAAAKAMDEGTPVYIPDVMVDPARAQRVMEELGQRLRQAEADRAIARAAEPPLEVRPESPPAVGMRPGLEFGGDFNYYALARKASDLLDQHESPFKAMRALGDSPDLSPELQNMLVGMGEFRGKTDALMEHISAMEWNSGGKVLPHDLIAKAVDNLRAGKAPEGSDTPLGRAAHIASTRPDMPVRMDDDGSPAYTAHELMQSVRDESRSDARDGNAYTAAVECFLRTGS